MKKLFSFILGFMLISGLVYSANTVITDGFGIDSSDVGGILTIKVSSAPVADNDTTHFPTCDDVYEETGTLFGSVSLSSPTALGTNAYKIQSALPFATTISTMQWACSGGTNVVFQIEQRTLAAFNSGGTDVFTGDVTAGTTTYSGGTFSDATVPSGYGLYLVITSVSGDVDTFEFEWEDTKD